ncbi:MAG: hypothetical protein M0035_06240 [Actinomycetota bacterium]|nr:hypothetical protein [Actinomycetota bacterium]
MSTSSFLLAGGRGVETRFGGPTRSVSRQFATALRATRSDPPADSEDNALNHALVANGYQFRRIDGLLVEHQEGKDLRRSPR